MTMCKGQCVRRCGARRDYHTYVFRSKAVTIMPNVGMSAEFFKDNQQFDEPFPDTGGYTFLWNAGSEIYYGNIALGFSNSHPGQQGLFSGKVEANDRFTAHFTIMS